MNRIGGKSNTGEAAEDPLVIRWMPTATRATAPSRQWARPIPASRVSIFVHAKELQIKMAQGAKPGEAVSFPATGLSVDRSRPLFDARRGMISPPPHHDIYSIEDLARVDP